MSTLFAVPQSTPYKPSDDALMRLRTATGQVVGSVFYGQLLASMRNSPLRGTIGHGGRGEEVFEAQLHGALAERIGRRTSGLSEVLFEHLADQQKRLSLSRTNAQDGGLDEI